MFNSNYLIYMDVTLTEMWREAFGSYSAMADSGVDLVVAEANVRYHLPARFDDELEIGASIEKLGRTSMTTRFDVKRGDDVIAVGHLRHVFIELGDGKTVIPDDIRTGLGPYVEQAD